MLSDLPHQAAPRLQLTKPGVAYCGVYIKNPHLTTHVMGSDRNEQTKSFRLFGYDVPSNVEISRRTNYSSSCVVKASIR